MIPVDWDEVAALGARRARAPGGRGAAGPITGIKADSRVVGPGDLFVALNTGRRARRRRRGARRRHARPRRPGGRPRGAGVARPLEERGARRRRRRLDRQDVDQGHPRRALQRRHPDGLGGGEPEQRDRPSAHRLPARAGHGGARHRDGHARARADRRALRDRPSRRRGRHVDRARAPRARRHRRARRRGERRGDRRAARRAASPSCRPMRPELEPHLGRTDIEIRRFDRTAIEGGGHEWTFPLAGGEVALTLPFTARHMAENTLAALVAYEALGLPLDRAQAGADAITLSRWRGEELPLPGGGLVDQRRLQREPDLDAGGAARPRRARRRPPPGGDPGRDGRARRRVASATTRRSGALARRARDRARRSRSARRARPYLGRRRAAGAALDSRRRRRSTASPASSGRATRSSSRRRVRSGSKASRPRSRNGQGHGPSPDRRPRRDGARHRDRPHLHRVAAPHGRRPADPRGRARRATSSSRARRRWAAS